MATDKNIKAAEPGCQQINLPDTEQPTAVEGGAHLTCSRHYRSGNVKPANCINQ